MYPILKPGKQIYKCKISAIWVERSGTSYLLLNDVFDEFINTFKKYMDVLFELLEIDSFK